MTAGYRRTGEQVKRRISTEDELGYRTLHTRSGHHRQTVAALHAELGFAGIQLVTGFLGNLPQMDVVRTIELFAKETRPLLRAMLAQADQRSAVA